MTRKAEVGPRVPPRPLSAVTSFGSSWIAQVNVFGACDPSDREVDDPPCDDGGVPQAAIRTRAATRIGARNRRVCLTCPSTTDKLRHHSQKTSSTASQ